MEPFVVAVLAGMSGVGILFGLLLGYWGNTRLNARAIRATEDALTQQIEQARTRSNEILQESQRKANEVKEVAERSRATATRQNRRERRDLQKIQRQIEKSKGDLMSREAELDARQLKLAESEEEFHERSASELERIAGLSRQTALERLLEQVEEDNSFEFKRRFREAELRFHDESDELAREILEIGRAHV